VPRSSRRFIDTPSCERYKCLNFQRLLEQVSKYIHFRSIHYAYGTQRADMASLFAMTALRQATLPSDWRVRADCSPSVVRMKPRHSDGARCRI
jgi:hypothetical protein